MHLIKILVQSQDESHNLEPANLLLLRSLHPNAQAEEAAKQHSRGCVQVSRKRVEVEGHL